jgi:gamma-glutamylputrescine oxidase
MKDKRNVNFSYWELKEFLQPADVIVIGSGIVGLSAAIFLKKQSPKQRILILERGLLPSGASTKNAGFACFGSPTELLDDLNNMPEQTVLETISMRWEGLSLLRNLIGDKQLDYKPWGGFEIFSDTTNHHVAAANLPFLNELIESATGQTKTYSIRQELISKNGFKNISGLIENRHEGQLDTGKMMHRFLDLAKEMGICILNGAEVHSFLDKGNGVVLNTNLGELKTQQLVVATNGFAAELLKLKNVQPARAQVLITKPIDGLKLKGAFHYDAGYYYFRNIDNRILLGGGRNLDIEGETTSEMRVTKNIQNALDALLKNTIIPYKKIKIETRWAGIMGVGNEKKPIIKSVSKNVIAAVRMGGMGVAIGSKVGQEVAKILK